MGAGRLYVRWLRALTGVRLRRPAFAEVLMLSWPVGAAAVVAILAYSTGSGAPRSASHGALHPACSGVKGAGAPINGAGASINGSGAPVNGEGAGVNGAGAPVNGCGAPVNGLPPKEPVRPPSSTLACKVHKC